MKRCVNCGRHMEVAESHSFCKGCKTVEAQGILFVNNGEEYRRVMSEDTAGIDKQAGEGRCEVASCACRSGEGGKEEV